MIFHNMKRIVFFLRLFFVGIIFATVSCSKDADDYLEKAAEAMAQENSKQAFAYYEKAYLLSLDDDFFPLGIKRNFQHLETNLDKSYVVLTSFEKDTSRFWFFNSKQKILKKGKIVGEVKQLSLSPAGNYTIFSVLGEQKKSGNSSDNLSGNSNEEGQSQTCELHLFSLEEKTVEKISEKISCQDFPAVNDNGLVVFLKDKTLQTYNAQEKTLQSKSELALKYPIESITPKASFFFSASARLFLSYGQAGIYNVYAIKGEQAVLLSDKVAFWRILFFANEPSFALVEGGAGKRSLVFFDEFRGIRQQEKSVSGTTDFSFVTSNHYYIVEKNQLKVHLGGETRPLPFFATTVRVDKDGQVYLLTPDAKFIKYGTTPPSEEVIEIFKKVQEFYN